ncbi:protein of unknown function [Georgenia satyanarayanai]|uniref:DUF4349 domain-containing protein n=1 Tax=Georgenia satyanarayanai TaxID=860221 RepID=A0A2Y9C641_9MICO|nr:DUF4349 domain-containing protein [Georgenia satyanarayanai]PYF99538.1 uncharacterized protein DUF4349 [Georgenia satyanarayanai]SSA42383.1 protein of unknown function [Georgenia satyanarayanai]
MRLLRTAVFGLVVLLGLVACSGGGSDSSDGGGAQSGADTADMAVAEVADAATGPREVVTTGSLSLVAADPLTAMDDVVGLVEAVGGYVEERAENAATDEAEASGWLTVRVPAAELTAVLDGLEAVGETRDVSISSEDVTRRGRDLDARIAALQTSTERLLGLMAEADSSEALLAAEDALSERQAELESLQAERAHLSEQVAMASLHVTIDADGPVQLATGGFVGGVQDGWGALVGLAGGLLVVLGALLPWILVLGVPLALVGVLLRRRRRRAPATA